MKRTLMRKMAATIVALMISVAMVGGLAGSMTVMEVNAASTISKKKAKKIAFKDAGVKSSEVDADSLSIKKKSSKYEIEFETDDYEYDYEINAKTGKIIEKDVEIFTVKAQATNAKTISKNKAKKIALKDAGVSKPKKMKVSLKTDDDDEFDYDDDSDDDNDDDYDDDDDSDNDDDEDDEESSYQYYEVSFRTSTYKYVYDIDAVNKTIIKIEMDRR